MEQWKTIPRATDYEISESGIVRRRIDSQNKTGKIFKKGHIIKDRLNCFGYKKLGLHCDANMKKQETYQTHRLVLEAFVGPCPKGRQCNHIDSNRINNHISNLEWITPKENVDHSINVGLRKPKDQIGEKNHMSKLKDGEVWLIKKLLASDMYKEGKLLQKTIAKMFNVKPSRISAINTGISWSHIKSKGG